MRSRCLRTACGARVRDGPRRRNAWLGQLAEGDTDRRAIASVGTAPAGRRPCHVQTLLVRDLDFLPMVKDESGVSQLIEHSTVLALPIGIGGISRCHPSHTTGHTGPYHGGSAD